MKRMVSFLLVLVLVLSLTGCQALDDARAAQAFYEEDGSVMWNGVRYLPLSNADNLYPSFDYVNNDLTVNVTEPDVPVLLSGMLGDSFMCSTDQAFLQQDEWNLFCRADIMDSVQQRLLNGFEHKKYGYWYYRWDDETYENTEHVFILSSEQMDAVREVLMTEVPQVQPSVVSLEYDHAVTVMGCSDDLLFREYFCEILYMNGTYYVVESNEDEYRIYKVPFGMVSTFEDVLREQIAADESYGWDEF